MVEREDAKFAKWMRGHGKIATLKDDEIERLERARRAVSGVSADEVMQSMYNRLDPKPQPPSSYTRKIIPAVPQGLFLTATPRQPCSRGRKLTPPSAWTARLTNGNKTYLMWSSLSTFRPPSTPERYLSRCFTEEIVSGGVQICVELKPRYLRVVFDEDVFMEGVLFKEIKTDESFWFLSACCSCIHRVLWISQT